MSFFSRSGSSSAAAAPSSSPSVSVSAPSPSSPNNASVDSPISAGRRQYKDLFTHQYAHVSHQTDEGLRSLKRSTAFFEHVCEQQLATTETTTKTIKSVKDKYADLKDEITHYTNAAMMIEEVMEHTNKTFNTFNTAVLNELVKPMRNWYKVTNTKKLNIDKEMNKLNERLKSSIEDINKERKSCLSSFTELKQQAGQLKSLESSSQTNSEPYNKLKKTWAKNKETTFKKFQAFESHLDNARTAQQNYYLKDIPAKLAELESIERERLQYQQECYNKFQSFYQIYTEEMKKSQDLMVKVLPTLNINKAMNVLIEKWLASFGAPPALSPIPYDLPCHWSEIQNDVLDSQGGAAIPQNNQPNGSGGMPASGSGAAPAASHPPLQHSLSASQYNHSNYANPPPPPPGGDDYNNPFASAAAAASVQSHPQSAAGAEVPLFMAEALFDFDLQSDANSDIQYVNFKTGERIKVFQEGDEWWYGELHGVSGFFPHNYVKRL